MIRKNKIFTVKLEAGKPEIDIFGYINSGDDDSVCYAELRDTLKELGKTNTECKININCAGGDMLEGFAIYDEMQRSPMNIYVDIVGMAASMGGIIALGGCEVPRISGNGSFMTHKPKGVEAGESSAMRSYADLMDSLEKRAIAIFMKATGKTEEEVKAWMQPGIDKWFDADEAIAAGLCKEKIPTDKKIKLPKNAFKSEKDAWGVYMKFTPNNNNKISMKKILMVLNTYKVAHTLTEESTEETVGVVVENALKERDAKIVELQNKIDADLDSRIKNKLDAAVEAGQLTAVEAETYKPMMKANFDGISTLVDKLPKKVDINNVIDRSKNEGGNSKNSTPVVDAQDRSKLPSNKADWTLEQMEIHDPKAAQDLLNTNPTMYAQKFKESYGVEFKQ